MEVAKVNLDNTRPILEVVKISNSNIGYEKYANKTHTIKLDVKIVEKNIKEIKFDREHLNIYLDNNLIKPDVKINKKDDLYEIQLSKIEGNGLLKIEFLEGIAIDISNLQNKKITINTEITIDNKAPIGKFSEINIAEGKSIGRIELNENIRRLDGWNINGLKAEKEFTNNISYEIPIIDYAGNKSIVNIDILKATYINIIYASHNSMVGWSFGYGNYDIAGKDAVLKYPFYKTEGLAFNVSGNIDLDFIRARAYIYTHWGEGSTGYCDDGDSRQEYCYGYNPSINGYKSMLSDKLATINGKKYFQFGGSRLNGNQQTDINGNNPIPSAVADEFRYGISGISISLKDYSNFSIVYQILVDKVGWIEACSDGKECVYDHKKPMSAFRMSLVPKTEKQYLIDTWNKDVGTFNLN